jgi:hypothetical protein
MRSVVHLLQPYTHKCRSIWESCLRPEIVLDVPNIK